MRGAASNPTNPLTRARANALSRWRRLVVVVAVLSFGGAASAQTSIYHIRGDATAGSNNVWRVDPTTGAETLVYANYPGGNAATLAQRPTDGMIFYAINAGGSNGPVYSFNPATPSVAPVLLGTLGAGVGSGFRMAFLGNTLYYMPGGGAADNNTLYTVNQTTGTATSVATITGTGNGGDMAFLGNTLYIINQNRQLYTSTTAGGAATSVGTVTFPGGITPNTLGLAFNATGQLLVQTISPSNLYTVTLPSLAAALFGALGGGTTATGDLASAVVPAPDFSITKTNGVSTVYRGGPVTYTIVVTNSGSYTVTGAVTDTVPASVTGVAWTCAASAGSSCAAASGSGNAINTSATLLALGTATYTVTGTISATATGTLTNTTTVAPPAWLTDATPADNTASDSDPINLNANLGITKTDGLANINAGSPITYTIVVSNAGPDASNGSIVTDTVPSSITGVTWTCGAATLGATCGAASGSGNAINTTANLPVGSSVTYTVSGTLLVSATGTLSNTATAITPASGVSDPTDLGRTGAGNNSATDMTTINAGPFVIGTVFEDVNYGGGAGRSLASSSGSPQSNARVELYNGSGTFVSSTTTNASGSYTFSGVAAGNYTVRVVNTTVTSSRAGYVATLIPVQTFRTDASSGGGVADTNRVGGEVPNKADAASNTTSATLASLTTASATAQSIAPVTVSSADVTGVDFGFNFDTIVNINNAGQGSLRRFIANSNALGNGGLAQAGLTAGVETSIFMISDGAAHPGLRAGLTNLFSGGTATIVLASALPNITDANTAIDGNRQTAITGDTNPAVNETTTGPEITLNVAAGPGLQTTAANTLFDSLGITGANGAATTGSGVYFNGAGVAGSIIRNSTVWNSDDKGITLRNSATNVQVLNNISRNNGVVANDANGIELFGASNLTISGNQLLNNTGYGIDLRTSANNTNTISNNLIKANGFGTSDTDAGIGLRVGSNNIISLNTITGNQGDGIVVNSGTGNTITQNSIYGNGDLGIDLGGGNTGNGVTINDTGDVDAGPNNLQNFAVLESTTFLGPDLRLTGYARPGSVIEVFIAAPDSTGFGEGQTYLTTLTEGSAQDADNTTGNYTNPFNGLNQGTDTTNRFSFTIPMPPGVNFGTVLTTTATLGGNTSEFSGNATVFGVPPVPSIELIKSVNPSGTQAPGTDLAYTVSFENTGTSAASTFTITDQIPANTDFRVGSIVNNLGSTGLNPIIEYSNDNGATWTYTPVSAAGGAPAGYDRVVTHVRWRFLGNLSHIAALDSGDVGFTVRIR